VCRFDIALQSDQFQDTTVVFQNQNGKRIKGKQMIRCHIIPIGAWEEFLDNLKKETLVKPVLAQACGSGLKL
jgi:hypothetical protein